MKACYHLPGLFEFGGLYRAFLPLFRSHREYFYDWCEIGSIYGAPADCLWGGGRAGFGEDDPEEAAELTREYGISARLTFSNSLLRQEHLEDARCNALCELFEKSGRVQNGVILASDLLLDYLRARRPGFYFVSSTTKVLTEFERLEEELRREEFRFVVPDFRLNKRFDRLNALGGEQKRKLEFLCNECCRFDCPERKACYESVCRKNLAEGCGEHVCVSPDAGSAFSAQPPSVIRQAISAAANLFLFVRNIVLCLLHCQLNTGACFLLKKKHLPSAGRRFLRIRIISAACYPWKVQDS